MGRIAGNLQLENCNLQLALNKIATCWQLQQLRGGGLSQQCGSHPYINLASNLQLSLATCNLQIGLVTFNLACQLALNKIDLALLG